MFTSALYLIKRLHILYGSCDSKAARRGWVSKVGQLGLTPYPSKAEVALRCPSRLGSYKSSSNCFFDTAP